MSETGPPHLPDFAALAVAQERQTASNLQVAEAVADLARTVEPAQAQYVRMLKIRAATFTALHAMLEVGRVLIEALASLFRGWWGGPVAILVLALLAALSLVWAGWKPADVTAFTVGTVHAVRCNAAMPSQPAEPGGALSRPLPEPTEPNAEP